MTTDRAAYIEGLRQLAAALEASPELPLPYQGHGRVSLTFHYLQAEDPAGEMTAAARALPCPSWAKEISHSYLYLRGQVAGGLDVELVTFTTDVGAEWDLPPEVTP